MFSAKFTFPKYCCVHKTMLLWTEYSLCSDIMTFVYTVRRFYCGTEGHISGNLTFRQTNKILIAAILLCALIMYQFVTASNTTCIKSAELTNLATCFSYNEPSSAQRQNEVLVHSVVVHCVGSNIVYNFNYIINKYL